VNNTSIGWTDQTWNPTAGCDKVSPGCKNCYAETIANRFKGSKAFKNGFEFTIHRERFNQPYAWRKPSRIFVNSMSDLFHEKMPVLLIKELFSIMSDCPQHTFQILTKRHKRLADLAPSLTWYENIWIGVSIENQAYANRVDYLRTVPANVRFLSCEPLLGPLNLDLSGIHWVIVGGESGPGARPMNAEWARDIRDQCQTAGAAFFMKQMGGSRDKRAALALIPADLQIRQFPK
jgi:protein gp37